MCSLEGGITKLLLSAGNIWMLEAGGLWFSKKKVLEKVHEIE